MKCPSSEFSYQFIELMQAGMLMSFHKYGKVRDAYPHKVNALESLRKRLEKYEETGNTEWLVDVANFAMIEFMCPAHLRAHFRATEGEESPGRAAYDSSLECIDLSNDQLTDTEWRELQGFRQKQK